VEFTIVTSSGNPQRVEMATLIQDDLESKLGMDVHCGSAWAFRASPRMQPGRAICAALARRWTSGPMWTSIPQLLQIVLDQGGHLDPLRVPETGYDGELHPPASGIRQSPIRRPGESVGGQQFTRRAKESGRGGVSFGVDPGLIARWKMRRRAAPQSPGQTNRTMPRGRWPGKRPGGKRGGERNGWDEPLRLKNRRLYSRLDQGSGASTAGGAGPFPGPH